MTAAPTPEIDQDTGLPVADLAPGPPPRSIPKVTRPPAGQSLLYAARIEAEAAARPDSATTGRQLARTIVEEVRTPLPSFQPAIGGELVPEGRDA